MIRIVAAAVMPAVASVALVGVLVDRRALGVGVYRLAG